VKSLDRLSADELSARLGDTLIGRRIVVLGKTTSTNDVVLEMASDESAEGLAVFAEHQIAGRGRHGNKWESAAGKGLWFSVLLRPEIAVAESARLTAWAAQSIAQTIMEQLGLPARIKLPNDIYVGDKKVAGVLVEMRARKNAAHFAILGVGINVNQSLEDFSQKLGERAASLAMFVGHPVPRAELAVALLRTLDRTYPAPRGL
jgi:BirA family transcriptional regulator, biotin operon repressor / biotin---[acetyl-CoA-carboxylase] ligase